MSAASAGCEEPHAEKRQGDSPECQEPHSAKYRRLTPRAVRRALAGGTGALKKRRTVTRRSDVRIEGRVHVGRNPTCDFLKHVGHWPVRRSGSLCENQVDLRVWLQVHVRRNLDGAEYGAVVKRAGRTDVNDLVGLPSGRGGQWP